jgi:hypothetical protein
MIERRFGKMKCGVGMVVCGLGMECGPQIMECELGDDGMRLGMMECGSRMMSVVEGNGVWVGEVRV